MMQDALDRFDQLRQDRTIAEQAGGNCATRRIRGSSCPYWPSIGASDIR
jgi:hypothetical protein